MAISKKNCHLAVQRNRLKRIIRESFRLHKAQLDGLDVVVINQVAASRMSTSELFDSLERHWQKFRRKNAKPKDIVLIAGKGHENYQLIGDRKIFFSDYQVGRESLRSRAGVLE